LSFPEEASKMREPGIRPKRLWIFARSGRLFGNGAFAATSAELAAAEGVGDGEASGSVNSQV
jgi:hypothetical protein